MNLRRIVILALTVAGLPLLAACNRPAADAGADADTHERGFIARTIDRSLEEARKELREGNLTLNGAGPQVSVNGKRYGPAAGDRGLPKAEITPQGDLLVDGEAVAIDDDQRALLLQYREQVIAVADAGIAIGGKGVGLAEVALTHAVGSILSGNTEDLEKRVEAEADKLKAEALVLCRQLPPMLATQQQLAASLPEFAPYATMTQDDIDDCLDELAEAEADAT